MSESLSQLICCQKASRTLKSYKICNLPYKICVVRSSLCTDGNFMSCIPCSFHVSFIYTGYKFHVSTQDFSLKMPHFSHLQNACVLMCTFWLFLSDLVALVEMMFVP